MTRLSAEKLLLALALHDVKSGTQMAGAYVASDGTATIELLELAPTGWINHTIREVTTAPDIATKYDDVVVTHVPAALAADAEQDTPA